MNAEAYDALSVAEAEFLRANGWTEQGPDQ